MMTQMNLEEGWGIGINIYPLCTRDFVDYII